MTNKSVIEMLKRPVSVKASEPEPVKDRSARYEHMVSELRAEIKTEVELELSEELKEKYKKEAEDELIVLIEDADKKTEIAVAALESMKTQVERLNNQIKEMDKAVLAERDAKDAANSLCDSECGKSLDAEKKCAEIAVKMADMDKRNISLQQSVAALTNEIKMKRPTRQAMPDFHLEVTSRGLSGEIKHAILKPTK